MNEEMESPGFFLSNQEIFIKSLIGVQTFKVLGTTAVNKWDKNVCLHRVYILEVETDAKQDQLNEQVECHKNLQDKQNKKGDIVELLEMAEDCSFKYCADFYRLS